MLALIMSVNNTLFCHCSSCYCYKLDINNINFLMVSFPLVANLCPANKNHYFAEKQTKLTTFQFKNSFVFFFSILST